MRALLALFLACASVANAITIFQDGFENPALGIEWSVSQSNDGRATISADHEPASGARHLILDDSVSDALGSVAEATLRLNLLHKKNVVLSFKAKSLGDEPNAPSGGNFSTTRNYDGVAISADGGTTWRNVQSLAAVGPAWGSFSVTLDSALASLGGSFGASFRVRFSQYDNAPAPLDGIALDDISVTADDDLRAVLELPSSLLEGSGPHLGYVLLSFAPTEPLTLTFTTSPEGQIITPPSVVVPAGESFASFEFSVANDAVVNLNRTITITPVGPAPVTGAASNVVVRDDESTPTATLMLPAQLFEGTSPTNNASISLNFAAAVPIVFSLTPNPTGEVTLPSTVTVPAGQTQVVFTAQATNDTRLDGNIDVTVTASAPLLASATAQTTAMDNEIPALSLTLPATLAEGTNGTATVTMSGPLLTTLTVNLSSSSTATLTVPATVTIPAGQTSGTFPLTTVNDTFVNLTRQVTINASGTGVTSTTGNLAVLDDEPPPVATLTLPAQLTEGSSPTGNATLSLNVAPAVSLTVSLSANVGGELSLPASVTVPSGQTQVVFTVQAVNDSRIDGNVPIIVTASASSIASVTAQVTTIDNETRTLSLVLPATVLEAATASGTVSIPGTLTTTLEVSLTNSNPGSLALPAMVTIPAGQTQTIFTITAVDNASLDGSRSVNVGATAPTFTGATGTLVVRDNELSGYRFSTLADIVNVTSPVSITVSGTDVEGNVIAGVSNSVNLSMVRADGSTQAVTPATVVVTGATGWTGAVTLPAVTSGPLRLRASDANGRTGESNTFDILRALNLTTADLLWDGPRGRIYASVPANAGGSYANQVVAIDPATLQITGSVTTNQDPGQIVMTGGGEYLYVALNANGTIARINPATMSVISTFAVGTDPYYGTLYADDMVPVAGQPNVLIVAQYRKNVSPSHNGVAAYDNGVIRPAKTQDHTGSNVIEPSANPAIYFGYNTDTTEYGFRRLQLASNGMTQLDVNSTLLSGFGLDLRSSGDRVYSTSGVAVDGALMKRLGVFPATGLVCPDSASSRVYFLEPQSSYDKIGAYDPTTFSPIRRATLSTPFTSPGSFIRWGANGLAFRSVGTVVLVGASQLVPTDPPADLAVTVQAAPNPATTGAPFTYTVSATNQGPNLAHQTLLTATLSDGQTIQSVSANAGVPTTSGLVVTLSVGELAAGATASLTITATPQSAGSVSCRASVNSNALDTNFANNSSFKLVSVGFQSAPDTVNQLRLTANNLINDPTRNLLWVSIPSTVEAPLGRSVVSINPNTGLVSDPIALGANPKANSIALSANGRYLYVGLSDVAEISRIDLNATPPAIVRVPLGLNGWNDAGYAADIEVLDGAGTSILATTTGDDSALVIDGTVRRTNRTGIYTVNRIERTATAGIFVGNDGSDLTRLSVTASGVAITQTVSNILTSYSTDIAGAGNVLLSSGGQLLDSNSLTLKSNLGFSGRPCIDGANQRAYVVNGNGLRAFDAVTGAATGTLTLPTTLTGDWAQKCVRWGLDGFAILGSDKIYIARWSSTIPAHVDQNNDGISDAWAAAHFGTLTVNPGADSDGDGVPDALEYLFGTMPLQRSPNPLQISTANLGDQKILHVTFPRRVGLSPASYGYLFSQNLGQWSPPANVTETILSTQTVNGVQIDTVDAAITCPSPDSGFARLRWTHP